MISSHNQCGVVIGRAVWMYTVDEINAVCSLSTSRLQKVLTTVSVDISYLGIG